MTRHKLKINALRNQLDNASETVKRKISRMVPLGANYDVIVIINAGKSHPGIFKKHLTSWTESTISIGEHCRVTTPHRKRHLGCLSWWDISSSLDEDPRLATLIQ